MNNKELKTLVNNDIKYLRRLYENGALKEYIPELYEVWNKGDKIIHDGKESLITHILNVFKNTQFTARIWHKFKFEITEKDITRLRYLALFHDLGMLYIQNDDKAMYAKSVEILQKYKDEIDPTYYSYIEDITKYLYINVIEASFNDLKKILEDIGELAFVLLCIFESINESAGLPKEQRLAIIIEYIIIATIFLSVDGVLLAKEVHEPLSS